MKTTQLIRLISNKNCLIIIPACSAQNPPEIHIEDKNDELNVNN